MNLTRILAIQEGKSAEYRWVAEHTTDPKFILEQRAGFTNLYAAYLDQIGHNWHSGYEAVFYERRGAADDHGRNEWWRLDTGDAIYIMQHETVMVEEV